MWTRGTELRTAADYARAVEGLAAAGMLQDASPELRALLQGAKLPTDLSSLTALQESLAMCLGGKGGRGASRLAKYGRFDPAEFPLGPDEASGVPGSGGVTRGRADATLTRGPETQPYDRFKAQPLPPGAMRSPDVGKFGHVQGRPRAG